MNKPQAIRKWFMVRLHRAVRMTDSKTDITQASHSQHCRRRIWIPEAFVQNIEFIEVRTSAKLDHKASSPICFLVIKYITYISKAMALSENFCLEYSLIQGKCTPKRIKSTEFDKINNVLPKVPLQSLKKISNRISRYKWYLLQPLDGFDC